MGTSGSVISGKNIYFNYFYELFEKWIFGKWVSVISGKNPDNFLSLDLFSKNDAYSFLKKRLFEFKGVILDFGQNRPLLENLQILNRWSKIDSDFFSRTLDAPKRAWTIVSWPQRSYRFLSADKQWGLQNLRIHSTGATFDRFWWVDYHFVGNGLNKSLQVFVLWYFSQEDRESALSWKTVF